jgi:hypothetical protein
MKSRFRLLASGLVLSLSISAQTEEWVHHYPDNTFGGPIIFLDNGNMLHVIKDGQTAALSERTTEGDEVDNTVYVVNDFIFLSQVAEDTILSFGADGQIYLLPRTGNTMVLAGALFPELAADNIQYSRPVITSKEDTLLARALAYETQEYYEAKIVYHPGEIYNEVSVLPYQTFNNAFSPAMKQAELSVNLMEQGPALLRDYQLRVSNPSGEMILDTLLDGNGFRLRKVVFESEDKLFILGEEETVQGFTASLFKLDLNTRTIDTMLFAPEEFPRLVRLTEFYKNDNQLVLAGSSGDGISDVFAVGLDSWGNAKWQYQRNLRFEANYVNRILINPNKPDEVYLAGHAGQNDTGNNGNAYLLKLSNLPTQTSSPAPSPLRFFPNPTKNLLTIEGLPAEAKEVEVLGITGRVTTRLLSGRMIDVGLLPMGTYFLRAKTGGEQFLGKFVKQ